MRRMINIVVFLVLILALVPVTSAAPQQAWTILGNHVVRPGETLFCIGRAYGVDPWAIATQNYIVNANLIYPGVTLAIPNAPATLPPGPICDPQFGTAPTPTPVPPSEAISCGSCTCAQFHTIVTGETLMAIALRYDVNMWTIAHCNCIYNLHYIRIGDALCIP